FLLLPDHALDRACAAAAIFLRPVQAGPAGIGFLVLPGFCDLEQVGALDHGAAERGLAQVFLILPGRIGRDPGFRLGAECGFLRGVFEVHLASLCVGWISRRRNPPTSSSVLGTNGGLRFANPPYGSLVTPRSSCACGRSARPPNRRASRASAQSHWRGGSTCGSRTPR